MKTLIINADDFGLSKIFNQDILKCIEQWYITSTTVMVLRLNIQHQRDDIETLQHLSKTTWCSIWLHLEYQNNTLTSKDMEQQYELFVDIFGTQPSHIDVHKYSSYHNPFTDQLLIEFAQAKDMGIRNHGEYDKTYKKTTKHTVYNGTRKTIEEIYTYINSIENWKTWEILLHPWSYDPTSTSSLNQEREDDTIMAQHIYEYCTKESIRLVSFYAVR